MKHYNYFLYGCLLSNGISISAEHLLPLQNSLEAFTDSLIRAPESYKKIESIFNIVLTHLNNTPQEDFLVTKTLKKKFIQKKTRSFLSASINHHAIDILLQKLWNKKNRQLTPQAKKILKKYKEYNALCYLKTPPEPSLYP